MNSNERFKNICLEGVPYKHLIERFNLAAGNEIENGKIFSERSSSALCMNAFGWFIERPELLPKIPKLELLDWPPLSVEIECPLRFPWRGGKSPWLDVVVETAQYLIGIESKRFEPYSKSTPAPMSDAYWRDVWGDNMDGYQIERDKFRENPKHYKHLSSRQLVAHSLGIKTQAKKKGKLPVLIYIHCDKPMEAPVKVTSEAISVHQSEVEEFANSVVGNEVLFTSINYAEWIKTFPRKIRSHGANLNKTYNLI